MRRLLLALCLPVFSACTMLQPAPPPAAPAPKAPELDSNGLPRVSLDGVEIERLPFRPGVSSATVEKMALAAGCQGGVGAGLVSPEGPVEVYRMRCENGKAFIARCELRQCRPLP